MDETAAHRVFEALQGATSQNPSILKPAEAKLKEWETESGFYSILLDILSNYDVAENVRWMAVLCLKNGVDRYWKFKYVCPLSKTIISETEKASIRFRLFNTFREPVRHIATQLAVLISRIARVDFHKEWNDLMPILLSNLQCSDHLIQYNSLLILHQVIKSLASKRLISDRKMFHELTASIYPFLYEQWNNNICATISMLNENVFNEVAYSSLEKSLYLLKILHKLTIHGFKILHESSHVCNFLTGIFDFSKSLLESRKRLLKIVITCNTGNNYKSMQELLEKTIINLTKILLAVLENYQFSYIDLIRPTLEFTFYYVFTEEGEQYLFEKFLILNLNRLKLIFTTAEYKPAKVIKDTKEPETLRAYDIKKQFLSANIVTIMCRKLITHYFLLTEQELCLWDSDPETFVANGGGRECWKYNLRPCTESLFLALYHDHRDALCPVLVDLIKTNHAPVSSDNINAILAKDAIYNAIGLAAFELYDEINFDEWFMTSLREELKIQTGNYRIVRRRVAWLIGQWIGVKLSCELRPNLYTSMLTLLQSGEDIAVRITASTTIKKAVDDFEFNTDQFLEFLEPSFNSLFLLLKEVNECDNKMHVLHVLSFIIERMGGTIKPFSKCLVHYLPSLWNESNEHNMLRCTIVSTLVHLVKAIGSLNDNDLLTQFLLSVIQISTDAKQVAYVYLVEEGLELWLAVLENTAVMTPPLLQLFNNLPPIIDDSSEFLQISLYIIQAYTLLGPDEFLQVYGEIVIRMCMYLCTDMREEGIVMIMKVLELCLKVKPMQAVVLIKPVIPGIIQAIHRADDLPSVMAMYFSIAARVLLISQQIFIQVCDEVSQSMGLTTEQVVGKVLDTWFEKLHFVIQQERRKLIGLAVASLLTSQSRVVLDRFCGFITAITEVLNDITRSDGTGGYIDSLIHNEEDDFSDDGSMCEITEHSVRRRQLLSIDPVHRLDLLVYFQQQIRELMNQVGIEQFNQLSKMVDNETLDNVKEYIQLGQF